jgi:hypothetical protein
MSSIRFETNADIEKWKNALKNMKNIAETAKSEKKRLKQFCDSQIENAYFWDRYARERTNDAKLKEIAAAELTRIISEVEMMNSGALSMYEKVLMYLTKIQIKVGKR